MTCNIFIPKVKLITSRIPKSRRLKIGKKYMSLSQPNVRVPLEWNLDEHPLFKQFLGYWTKKGYFDRYSVVLSCGDDIATLMPCFDYVAETFKCNYRIQNKLVKFDSAILKYTMLGLEFNAFDRPLWCGQDADFMHGRMLAEKKFAF